LHGDVIETWGGLLVFNVTSLVSSLLFGLTCRTRGYGYDVQRQFQQYFGYILVVSFIDEGNNGKTIT
jgi:hypothetical protein